MLFDLRARREFCSVFVPSATILARLALRFPLIRPARPAFHLDRSLAYPLLLALETLGRTDAACRRRENAWKCSDLPMRPGRLRSRSLQFQILSRILLIPLV